MGILHTTEVDLIGDIHLSIFEDGPDAPARSFNLDPLKEDSVVVETRYDNISGRVILSIGNILDTYETIKSDDLEFAPANNYDQKENYPCELCGSGCVAGVYTDSFNPPWNLVHKECLETFVFSGRHLWLNAPRPIKAKGISRYL